ncbi:keywimysin-related RiPP [Micromonospora tarensis]|uniref:Lasso RiPP family leader peptide-containing protein n=1 Tax=Micromonospora tarensis TaxID=2806100 RepID=A0ABS1YAM2_9ACTN|nr:keywimysin-related RiPP [Micromonospora tarensis]MBM0274448.1 lasso RiPP family leader peptide-containing protein [Micromonospora tarensis]
MNNNNNANNNNTNNNNLYETPSFTKVGSFRKLTGFSITTISAELFLRRFI